MPSLGSFGLIFLRNVSPWHRREVVRSVWWQRLLVANIEGVCALLLGLLLAVVAEVVEGMAGLFALLGLELAGV